MNSIKWSLALVIVALATDCAATQALPNAEKIMRDEISRVGPGVEILDLKIVSTVQSSDNELNITYEVEVEDHRDKAGAAINLVKGKAQFTKVGSGWRLAAVQPLEQKIDFLNGSEVY